MKEISVLIGGKAGDGIRQAGTTIARLFSRLGYHIFFYDDYPSLIRGGHNFSIVRASEKKITAHRDKVHIIVALNQFTVEKHEERLESNGFILYDSDKVKSKGIGIPLSSIVKEAGGLPIMRNTAAIGALAKLMGIEWPHLEKLLRDTEEKEVELNVRIAEKAYSLVSVAPLPLKKTGGSPLPLVSGNEAIALGAVKAGLNLYIAYPMTPASSILHYLAAHEEELGVVTVHPENEIGVMLMALGAAFAGARTMVGTSGGGFALMTEGLSLSAQGEFPVVIVECQRAGPSTGVPTYTMQADLLFVVHSGHGDMQKVVFAPGDAEEAFYLTGLAMNCAWKFQIPAFVLSDKHLSESLFTFGNNVDIVSDTKPVFWDGTGEYKRYSITDDGISPLAFPGEKEAIVKGTSYEHDAFGITTEEAGQILTMQDKRLRKQASIERELASYDLIKVYGNKNAETVLVCWGSTKGACREVAEDLGLKVVQPLALLPFPSQAYRGATKNARTIIDVETNATGQLAKILGYHGFHVNKKILRYDARPFTVDYLAEKVKEVLS